MGGFALFKKLFGFGKKKEEIEQLVEEGKKEIEESAEKTAEEISEKTEVLREEIEREVEEAEKRIEHLDEYAKAQIETSEKLEEIGHEIEEELEELESEVETELHEIEEKLAEDVELEETEEEIEAPKGIFGRLKAGLLKTRRGITEKIDGVLKSYRKIDEELFEDLEEVLIMADIGVDTSLKIIENVKDKVRERKITEVDDIKGLIKEEMKSILKGGENSKLDFSKSPSIVLVVGVNGAGKTTTIGKLSSRLKNEGKKVLIAAGDTFRAAAIEQLQEWSNRSGVDIIAHSEGADPAAVIFDGIQSAKAKGIDVLICDTAGRLHNKVNLMNELNKIFRIVEREFPEAKKEVLLVVDATTGQNAVQQAKVFKEACDITGIVLTKLDGTAKGGVVLAVQSEINVPVKLVGVGEKLEDLQDLSLIHI